MTLLSVSNLQVMYGRAVQGVRDISLNVGEGEIVALLGPNGAGKSTVLKSISGVLGPEDGKIVGGGIRIDGQPIEEMRAEMIVEAGVIQVPEGRQLFIDLTVAENLQIGGHLRPRAEVRSAVEEVYDRFPVLRERRNIAAGFLSGGEQQMVALGRALISRPRLLMLDEPSLGLAPQIVAGIFETLGQLRRDAGISVLVIEQNARVALRIADRGYVVESGRMVMDGTAATLMQNDDIKHFYLGLSEGGKARNFRDIKHYKRRKRWLS